MNAREGDEQDKDDGGAGAGAGSEDSNGPLELLTSHDEADDDDDDDDDDNWSRQVETDETVVAGGDESVSMREAMETVTVTVSEQQQQLQQEQQTGHLDSNNANSENGRDHGHGHGHGHGHVVTEASSTGIIPLGPVQPELTMKEKLVLRERQRRIETERARLKRQFALSNDQEGRHEDDVAAAQNLLDSSGQLQLSEAAVRVRDNGSAAGTLGEESTVAHPDEDVQADEEKLGFNMERFLRNSDSFNPELEPTAEDKAAAPNSNAPDQGPVMERFLNEPVVMGTSSEADAPKSEPPTISTEVQRSVSFEVNMDVVATDENSELGGGDDNRGIQSLPSFNETTPSIDANVSVLVHADEDDDVARDPLIMSMTSMDAQESVVSVEDGVMMPSTSNNSSRNEEPRFLRLTEADMQEMAAIEEASIGNGPPSERSEEDLSDSEIGELVDFRGGHQAHDAAGNLSQDTPTTVMDSASMLSGGNQSAQPTSATSDRDHIDIVDQHSLDGMPSVSVSSQLLVSPGGASVNNPMSDTARDEQGRTTELFHQPILEDDDDSDDSSSEVLVNRRLRPGMGSHLRPQTTARPAPTGPLTTAPQAPTSPLIVEGFDFDKDEPMSPQTEHDHNDSLHDLPDVGWSPGAGKMSISPIQIHSTAARLSPTEEDEFAAQSRAYGSIMGDQQGKGLLPGKNMPFASMKTAASNNRNAESLPLLGDVPPEITTRRQASQDVSGSEAYPSSLRSALQGALPEVQAEKGHGKVNDADEAALYDSSSTLKKGKRISFLALCDAMFGLFRRLTLYYFSLSRSHACALRNTDR
jgi:hypothetical protein